MIKEISGERYKDTPSVSKLSTQRLTQRQKDANDFKWYKERAKLLNSYTSSTNQQSASFDDNGITEYTRMKANYDLFNNILNKQDFNYVIKPFGEGLGELPANLTNRDIVSGKIKVLLGMEMKMPFSWKVIAVNEEATTRKEQEEFKRIKEFVVSQVMQPVRQQKELEIQQQIQGKELTPEEQRDIQMQVEEETRAQTPDEVRKYMSREHQDPAEVLAHQLLQYITRKEAVADKFNKGWKHTNLSGVEVYNVSIINGEPALKVVNPLFFRSDMSPDIEFIENGEWASMEYRMTPSETVSEFGSELDDDEVDRIYEFMDNPSGVRDSDFTFEVSRSNSGFTLRVMHYVWKSLMKIGFLTYKDKKGSVQEMMVDENYRFDRNHGDIELDWEWIPEVHEVYQILDDIFVYPRPVPGQHKDPDNLWECKLPYYGAVVDAMNSAITSPMDRMKMYQYLYNVVLYRIELLMASDKGKILAANINAIPKKMGMDVAKWQYFLEANKIAWFNPFEEGNRGGQGGDVTNLVKEIDMSLASDIDKYIRIAEYIETKCGNAVGVTKQMEAQIGPDEAVTNTRQNLTQASHIVHPYFELHNIVKRNVLTALLETAKVAYSTGQPRKLSYVLDDMSAMMLTIDQGLLDSSTYGIFVSNSIKAEEARQAVVNLSQAAMQNQQADLADIVKVMRSESIQEAEELLMVASSKKQEQAQAAEQANLKAAKEVEARKDKLMRDSWKHEADMIVLKEGERRKTEVQKQAIMSMGFDPNKDEDQDQVPDVLEVAKFGVDADIKMKKLELDEAKLEHQKKVDEDGKTMENKRLSLDRDKLDFEKSKPKPKPSANK